MTRVSCPTGSLVIRVQKIITWRIKTACHVFHRTRAIQQILSQSKAALPVRTLIFVRFAVKGSTDITSQMTTVSFRPSVCHARKSTELVNALITQWLIARKVSSWGSRMVSAGRVQISRAAAWSATQWLLVISVQMTIIDSIPLRSSASVRKSWDSQGTF